MNCVEKIAFSKPPKYNASEIQFEPVQLFNQVLNQMIYVDVIEPNVQEQKDDYSFIFSHGNAENVESVHGWLLDMSRVLGSRVISYDYPGYGQMDGKPTQAGCNKVIEQVYDYVVDKYKNTKVVSWGKSIGSAFAIHLAATKAVDALIIQSGLSSAFMTLCKQHSCISCDKFQNCDILLNVNCKILLIHGTDDEIVPYRCSIYNFEAYNKVRNPNMQIRSYYNTHNQNQVMECGKIMHVSVFGASHNDVDTAFEEVLIDELRRFLGDDFGEISVGKKETRSVKQKSRTLIL